MWSSSSVRKRKIKTSIANPVQQTESPGTTDPAATVIGADADPHAVFFLPSLIQTGPLLRLMIITSVLAVLLVLVPAHTLAEFSADRLFAYLLFMNWCTASFAIITDWIRPYLLQLHRIQAALLCIVLIDVIVVASTLVVHQIQSAMHLITITRHDLIAQCTHNFLLTTLISSVLLHYLYVREQLVLRERAELFARLDTLQARIRPHFLFNSMNTLLSLIETDPRRASIVVEDLSALFRASLKKSGMVTLQEEVRLCKRYLAIESLRLAERLQVEWHVLEDPLLEMIRIPSLTLQPLIENAIIHGIEPSSRPSLISILTEWDGDEVKIVVTNPIPITHNAAHHSHQQRQPGNQMALNNIHERLQAHYGPTARLSTHRGQDFFTAYLSYPYSTQPRLS